MVRRALGANQLSRATDRLMVIFAAIAAALFLLFLAGLAIEKASIQGSADVLYGKITALDTSHPTGSLTLHSLITGVQALNVFVNDDTTVKMCDRVKSLKDIKTGSHAQVTYYELAGVAVANFIYVPC